MIYQSLFTIFILLAGGYISKLIKVLKQKQSRSLFDFVVVFALPCLIFDKIYHLNFNFSLILLIFAGFISTSLAGIISVIIGRVFKFSKPTILSMFVLSAFGNTLFVGMPVVSNVFGEEFVGEVIMYDSLAGAIPISILVPLILAMNNGEKVTIVKNIKTIIYFPPFIGLVLGLALKGFEIPEFVFAPIRMFGGSATPVALFAIGLSLGFNAIKSSYKSTVIVLFMKMILAPAIFILILQCFGAAFDKSTLIAVLESSMPTATIVCVMVMKAKLDSNLAASSVAFGLVLSVITLPILLNILTGLSTF
ncbi:AEC family transporter [Campylobacter hominis]|uniref:Transporter, auxin efflux carrier (AEC) family n=1 Tax=Campylobacter hominis (strain ATCC BAA-381 / DSM 21671 / CCUG 45161 / LMG 19568 / NCTC 13146 / CH001A) TaxID=360107 RepID=A7HZG4_CAMHC|nr:AEC family transporter [Campylobacter hominis]ABS52056.1 transporter, auxin efflux carrier (AEC) family [Campylobacter hominis ATCC BAA-381]UAK85480.1 AEC family transporter [Campylobacter hominis]SUW84204.1 auxin efflux carrier (AEC) family protein [Campylobacter hominis]